MLAFYTSPALLHKKGWRYCACEHQKRRDAKTFILTTEKERCHTQQKEIVYSRA